MSRLPSRRTAVFAVSVLASAACASHRVLMPPELDLVPYGSLGVVRFSVEGARGGLNELVTARFEEYVLAAQRGFELQRFQPSDSGEALGGARGVGAVFLGHLKISDVKPSSGFFGAALAHVQATVSAELSVELRSTKTGGTLWRSSARRTEKVGELTFAGGVPEFSARNPDEAYGQLVNRLVHAVTWDMRSTWVKQ